MSNWREFPNRKIGTDFFQMGISSWRQKDPVFLSYLNWDRRNYQAIYREQKPVQEKRLTRRKINPLPKEISYNEEDKLLNARNYDDGENIDE